MFEKWTPIVRERTGVLKGLDNFTISETTVFEPGKLTPVPVLVTPDCYPQFKYPTVEKLAQTRISLRSRLAQSGFDGTDEVAERAFRLLRPEDVYFDGEVSSIIREVTVPATLVNRSQRSLQLIKGSGIGRFFYCDWARSGIFGKELKEMCLPKKGEPLIQIGGEFEDDWVWKYFSNAEPKDENISGVFVRLKPSRFWLPPNSDLQPLVIDDKTKNYRDEIDKNLVKTHQNHDNILWISETPPIKLVWGIDGVLSSYVHAGLYNEKRGRGYHINSLLIDGGSNWPIRVEIVSDDYGNSSYYVAFTFATSRDIR